MEIKIWDILTVACKQEEEKAIAAIKENPKFFYEYAAKYSEIKCRPSQQGQSVHEPKDIAEKL